MFSGFKKCGQDLKGTVRLGQAPAGLLESELTSYNPVDYSKTVHADRR